MIALSLAVVSMAACSGSKPETSEVKAFLNSKFESCKNIKVTNIKKTNGYPHPKDASVHVVEYAYTIALKNPSEYKALAAIYKQEKEQVDAYALDIKQALENRSRASDEQTRARDEGDAERGAQATRDFLAANNQAYELEKKSRAFTGKTKIYQNVSLKVSGFYFEGCSDQTIKEFTPSKYGYGGRILNLGIENDDSPEWFAIQDIDMTGEAMLRKTDNGWRGIERR